MLQSKLKRGYRLLTQENSNPKLAKGQLGYMIVGLSLAPANESGYNMCPNASPGCMAGCLHFAGHGRYNRTREARIKKTHYFMKERELFLAQLKKEIGLAEKRANKKGVKLAVRLNVYSDFPWESTGIMEEFPNVQFYDYTKMPKRYNQYLEGKLPKNYDLTFSRSELNDKECLQFLQRGGRIAVVGENPYNYPSISGDNYDHRFLDPPGVVILKPKGRIKKDKTGMVFVQLVR